jgi:methylmalonyl-CoA/ethylmalonyl-CoA epimerase
MPEKPIFTDVLQVAVVVKNLDQAIKNYWETYGIGPWAVYEFNPSTVSDMIIDNEREDYAMRLALCNIGKVQWELIEPLDDKSIYADFLKKHGEGLHHVAFGVDNYDQAMAYFKDRGIGVCQGGTWHGLTYTYLESEDTFSSIAEIYSIPPGFEWPTPEATYP